MCAWTKIKHYFGCYAFARRSEDPFTRPPVPSPFASSTGLIVSITLRGDAFNAVHYRFGNVWVFWFSGFARAPAHPLPAARPPRLRVACPPSASPAARALPRMAHGTQSSPSQGLKAALWLQSHRLPGPGGSPRSRPPALWVHAPPAAPASAPRRASCYPAWQQWAPLMLHAQMHCSGFRGGTGIATRDKSRVSARRPDAESARCESHIQGQKIEGLEY